MILVDLNLINLPHDSAVWDILYLHVQPCRAMAKIGAVVWKRRYVSTSTLFSVESTHTPSG